MSWQPISTAPRDGSRIVLWAAAEDLQCEGSVDADGNASPQVGVIWTHWKPRE